tara:strand:+ start:1220 stop:2245 length:1026 start_codon:yes stop_codon:yes gene_type:complete
MKRNVLVTGAAGFIGAAIAKRLILNGDMVVGIDNISPYYDVSLKRKRLKEIEDLSLKNINWNFYKTSIENYDSLYKVFDKHKPEIVINLAAQAGVRYSLKDPNSYIQTNLVGFGNIMELVKCFSVQNFIYASSSSVYGGNTKLPYSESDPVNHPVSLYAATKRSNEVIAHAYSHIYRIPSTCLRFFTVYGPLGRPDMAPMIFANSILNSEPIKVFNYGKMSRDFTYIDDVVDSIFKCSFKKASSNNSFDSNDPDPASSKAPHIILNIGNSTSVKLLKFIEILEVNLGKKAIKEFHPIQPGDVVNTFADSSNLKNWINFAPKITIEEGLSKFAKWYKDYYGY